MAGSLYSLHFAEVYQKYLGAACLDIVSGAFDNNSVLRRVVTQLTNSRSRQIDYASGHGNRGMWLREVQS